MYPNIYLHFLWKKHTCWILVHSEASVSLSAYVPTYHLRDSVSKTITTQNQKGNGKLSVIRSLFKQSSFHPARLQSQPSSPAPKCALGHNLLYRERYQSCCPVFVFFIVIVEIFINQIPQQPHTNATDKLLLCLNWWHDIIDNKWRTVLMGKHPQKRWKMKDHCLMHVMLCSGFSVSVLREIFMPFECFKRSTFCPERKLKSLVALSLKILLLS